MEENQWQTFECPTLPPGWTREVVARKQGKSAGKQSDVYYRSPNGRRVRSKPALIQRLGSQGNPVDLNMFEWRSGNMNPELIKPKAKRRRTNSKGSSSDMSSIEGEDSVPVEEKYLNVPSTPSSNTYPLPINMTHSKPLHNGTAPMKLPKNWKETLCPILKSSSPVKLSKDWREKLSTEKIFKPKANSPQSVKLAKDWKETSRSISSSISHGRLPTTHTPVKLSKDWKEKAGLKASTSIAHGSHEKLPKNWRERSKDMPIANVNAIHATKLPKNWKDLFDKQPRSSPKIISNSNSKQNSLVQGSTTSPVKLPKDWRKPEAGLGGWGGTRVRVEPTKLPKNWNQTVAVNKTPQVGERGENAQNYTKLSTDWNKNLALSRSAFAVKLPKGWMDEALEEQRLRRLERNQSTSEAHQRREHRHHADYALVLPSGWESLTPKELVDNLCSSDQARKLSSEVRENFERDLLSRLEEVEKDQLAVRLEKGWHKGLPPLPEVEDTQLPARLVLPRDWEERDVESLAEELGVTLPSPEKVNILPETWATDLRKDGKATKRRNNIAVIEGAAKKRELEDKSLHQSPVEEESKKGLCEYELIRQENIRQRDALFAKLGLEDAKASVATKGKNKSATGGSKPKKGKRRDDMEKNGKERSLKSKNGKSGSGRPEKEVTPAEKEQLEMPALQGWKREVVLSKGCPRMDEDFNVVEGLDEVTVVYWPPWEGGEALLFPKITNHMRRAGVKRLQTKKAVAKFLKDSNSTLSLDNFSFLRRALGLKEGFEVVRRKGEIFLGISENEEEASKSDNVSEILAPGGQGTFSAGTSEHGELMREEFSEEEVGMGNTVEEAEEESILLNIIYQGEVEEQVWARPRWRVSKVVTAWVSKMRLTSIAKTLSFKCGKQLLRGVERISELQDASIFVRKEKL